MSKIKDKQLDSLHKQNGQFKEITEIISKKIKEIFENLSKNMANSN